MIVPIEAKDVITVLTAQRNTAMDEIVRQAAIIKSMERELEQLRAAVTPTNHSNPDLHTQD